MRKTACEAILAEGHDRRRHADLRGAKAEIEALRADNERKDAEIEALKRANAHDGGPHAPPSHNTLSGKAEKRARGGQPAPKRRRTSPRGARAGKKATGKPP